MSLFELTYLNLSTNIVNYMQDCLEELMETIFNMLCKQFLPYFNLYENNL